MLAIKSGQKTHILSLLPCNIFFLLSTFLQFHYFAISRFLFHVLHVWLRCLSKYLLIFVIFELREIDKYFFLLFLALNQANLQGKQEAANWRLKPFGRHQQQKQQLQAKKNIWQTKKTRSGQYASLIKVKINIRSVLFASACLWDKWQRKRAMCSQGRAERGL